MDFFFINNICEEKVLRKFTNFNKMNNLICPETIEHKKNPQLMALEMQALGSDRHTNVAGLKGYCLFIQCICLIDRDLVIKR
jgi:hypothetical protein